MTIKLVHTENTPVETSERARILVMGQAARGLAAALLRLRSTAEICAADTGAEALEFLRSGEFDHVLVDNREDGALALTIPALARVKSIGKLTVLAGPQSAETILAIPGVDDVIQSPYNPIEIAKSLGVEVVDSRTEDQPEDNLGRREHDIDTPEIHGEVERASVETVEEEDMRPVYLKAMSALARVIPGLTPILSLLYKNIALTLLAALFVAFISYGVMIAYFLIAGDWSTPLQLQRGHETVIKAERERGELQVKRNLVLQQMADAQGKEERAQKDLDRADVLAQIVGSTLDQEIENQKDQEVLIDDDLKALEGVLGSYGSKASRQKERERLRSAFKRRVITRRNFQQSMLNLSEIEENIVNLNERISRKQNEQRLGSQAKAYLTQLKAQLSGGTSNGVIATGKAEFIPIANQVIEVQQIRAAANSDLTEATAAKSTLENSISVLTNSIKELESTPMIRALEQPVNVLFVPYDNINSYEAGEPLYTCAFAIFWCTKVGTVGDGIGGEIVTTHPFFGKPIRGQFVEANLTEKSAAQEEIIHVGRPPLFF
ncbi:MAG: hypothetical protein QNJ29_02005 [Rhizobiaceae bacterium]|nr:hypothetical protein [Rhizobiaceae bacterium]